MGDVCECMNSRVHAQMSCARVGACIGLPKGESICLLGTQISAYGAGVNAVLRHGSVNFTVGARVQRRPDVNPVAYFQEHNRHNTTREDDPPH